LSLSSSSLSTQKSISSSTALFAYKPFAMSGKICAATGSGVFKVEISNLDVRKVRMTTSSSRNESVDLIFAFAAISSVESMAKSGETPKFKKFTASSVSSSND